MADFRFIDRIREVSNSSGTGAMSLVSTVPGFQAWAELGNNRTAYYVIEAVDDNNVPTGQWETGIGTWVASGNQLQRTNPKQGSGNAGGALVNFAAGRKLVYSDAIGTLFYDGFLLDTGTTGRVPYSLEGYGLQTGAMVYTAASGLFASTLINATTGFRVNGSAASNAFLVGDGTNFVSSSFDATKVLLGPDVDLSPVTANTNTSSAQNLMAYTFPSGWLNTVGRTFRCVSSGINSTKTGTQPAMAYSATLGGVALINHSTFTPSATGSNGTWYMEFLMSTFSSGSSGTVLAKGWSTIRIPAGGTGHNVDTNTGASGAINLTGSPVLQIQVTFSTNPSASNTSTQQIMTVERLN